MEENVSILALAGSVGMGFGPSKGTPHLESTYEICVNMLRNILSYIYIYILYLSMCLRCEIL